MESPIPERYAQYYLGNGPSLVTFLVLDAAAFLVGVSFYVHSDPALADLPTFLYPLFGDSPTALALATLSLATLLPNLGRRVRDAPQNRPLAYLHTLAFVWLVKYGLWTPLALNVHPGLYVGFTVDALWNYWGIVLTHLGFVVQAFLVPHYGRTTRGALAFALGLSLVNDAFDYGLGYYPPLRYEPGVILVGATLLISLLAVWLADRSFDRLERGA
ncbi:MAG: DUF1405 domain-containing protein [Haloferacaceae archaeon]